MHSLINSLIMDKRKVLEYTTSYNYDVMHEKDLKYAIKVLRHRDFSFHVRFISFSHLHANSIVNFQVMYGVCIAKYSDKFRHNEVVAVLDGHTKETSCLWEHSRPFFKIIVSSQNK